MVSRRKLLLIFCAACGTFSLLCVWSYFIRMEKFYWEASKFGNNHFHLKSHLNTHWIFNLCYIVYVIVVVVVETTENSMYNHGESAAGGGSAAALRSHHNIHDNTNSFDDNLVVIYNRVPKTGSTSFINLAYDLCKRNHFYVLHINITANMHVLSLNNQVSKNKSTQFFIFHFVVSKGFCRGLSVCEIMKKLENIY